MKYFLKLLMMAFVMFAVEPGEGGGDGGSGDGIEPPEGGSEGGVATPAPASNPGSANPPNDTVNVPKEVFEKIASSVEHMENMHAINAAVTGIKSEIPDFDLGKVHAKLEEMHKTDPEAAKALNRPAGWKMLWKSELADGDVKADGVNGGRKNGGDTGRDDLASKINSGDSSIRDQADFYAKYFE